MTEQRRLAAILSADVRGYSRMMGADETGTLNQLKAHRAALVPLISARGGRVVKTTGDGLLVEFASVVAACEAALDMQRLMRERNSGEPDARRMDFRMGIHLGDVIVDEDDIYGDGVNISARLQELAEPGGIVVSEVVASSLRGKLSASLTDIGIRSLKNISEPMRVLALAPEQPMVDPMPPGLQAPAVPPKPSIAVLAFTNMSGDPEQEYFSDGLAEDIITALSRISALFVIARNSSFTYKGRAVDIRSVGRELGVRYVLEGSVRRQGSRLRVTAQLIHAESGAHVWAEKFDRDTVDLFLIQDEITRSVAASIDTQIRLSEGVRARPAQGGELEVWAQIRKVWHLVYEFNEEALLQARKLAEAALAMAPNSGSAHQALSVAIDHLGLMREGPRDPGEIDRVRDLALRAVQLSEDDEYAHWALGNAYMRLKDYDRAIASYNRALEINPNCSPAYALLGNVLLFVGRVQDGIDNMEMALRTNPRDPANFFRYSTLGLAFLMLGDYRAAASWAKRAIDRKPNWLTPYLTAAVAESLLGHEEVARNWVRRYLAIFPSGSLKDLDRFDPTVIERIGYPAILRKLGLPEWAGRNSIWMFKKREAPLSPPREPSRIAPRPTVPACSAPRDRSSHAGRGNVPRPRRASSAVSPTACAPSTARRPSSAARTRRCRSPCEVVNLDV